MSVTVAEGAEKAEQAPRRKGRLHVATVETLREMIVSGALPPGQKLREQELCERLGVSRTPLREALRTLAAQGLVTLSQNRGAEVAALSLDDIGALFEVVSVLEALAARLACKAVSDVEVAAIALLHEQMRAHHAQGELAAYFALNQRIHRAIIEAARNPVLLDLWERMAPRVERAKYLPNRHGQRWNAAMREHEAMVTALRERDGERLAALMRQHFANGLAVVQSAGDPARAD